MDFVMKLPKMVPGLGSIWVIVHRLTKSEHFIPVVESIFAEKLADIYIGEVVVWHRLPISVASDRDVRFTSRFWRKFHEELST